MAPVKDIEVIKISLLDTSPTGGGGGSGVCSPPMSPDSSKRKVMLKKTEGMLNNLEKMLDQKKSNFVAVQMELESLRIQLGHAQERCVQLERDVAEARLANQIMRQETDMLAEAKEEELEALNAELDEARSTIESLRAQLEESERASEDAMAAQAMLQEAHTAQVAQLTDSLRAVRAQGEKTKQELKRAQEELQASSLSSAEQSEAVTAHLRAEIENLSLQLQKHKMMQQVGGASKAEVERVREDAKRSEDALKAQIKAQDDELQMLRATVSEQQASRKVAAREASAAIDALTENARAMEGDLRRQLESKCAEFAQAQQRLSGGGHAAAREATAALKALAESARGVEAELRAELAAKDEECRALQERCVSQQRAMHQEAQKAKLKAEDLMRTQLQLQTKEAEYEKLQSVATEQEEAARAEVERVKQAVGSTESVDEMQALQASFTEHINACLRDDPDVSQRLPITPAKLFDASADGLIFCKLINLAAPETVDERAINTQAHGSTYQMVENHNLAINAAKAIGCTVASYTSTKDLMDGRPQAVLDFLWQIIRTQQMAKLSVKEHPELVRVLQAGEDVEALKKMAPEDILKRWVNVHLTEAGSAKRVANLGRDLCDLGAYSTLLHKLDPAACDTVTEADPEVAAEHVIRNAKAIGVKTFVQPIDILSGNKRLNTAFVAQIFNAKPGLSITQEELTGFDLSNTELDDAGDTREERQCRMWINSLGIDSVYVHHLFSDLTDGLVLLKSRMSLEAGEATGVESPKVMDLIQPGLVNWKKVNTAPTSRFKKVENGNQVVQLGKQMNLVLVNVGGLDIVDQNKKLVLTLVAQLMRRYVLDLLKKLSSNTQGDEVCEEQIVQWANTTVARHGKHTSFASFRDSSVSDSRFLLDLLSAIEPRAVKWDLVIAGSSQEVKLSNAKYCINIARKIGACVFITPEDIVEVKPKSLMTFVASLWAAQTNRIAGHR